MSAALWVGHNVTVEAEVIITPGSRWQRSFDAASFASAGGGAGAGGGDAHGGDGGGGDGGGGGAASIEDVSSAGALGRALGLLVYDVNANGARALEAVEASISTRDVLTAFFLSPPRVSATTAAAARTGWLPSGVRRLELGLGTFRLLEDDRDNDAFGHGRWEAIYPHGITGKGEGGDEGGAGRGSILGGGKRAAVGDLGALGAGPRWLWSARRANNGGRDVDGAGGGAAARASLLGASARVSRLKDPVHDPGPMVTVAVKNVTITRQGISEDTRRAAAVSVTAMRGVVPMHAVWAGISATRYVRQLWLAPQLPVPGRRGVSVDVFAAIGWSWLYHGTFDFAIMAIPALTALHGADEPTVLTLSCVALAMVLLSWSHLARATVGLERELTTAGLAAPGGGAGLPRLGTCTGRHRRRCGCCCLPFAACLCWGVAEWGDDGGGAGTETGSGSGSGTYGSITK